MVVIWFAVRSMDFTAAGSPDKSLDPIEVIEFDLKLNKINCVYCNNPDGILVRELL